MTTIAMADNLHQDDGRSHLRTLTMGNPMVDMILHVSKDFIEEQGLIHGESIHGHVSTETRQELFDFVLASPHAIRTMGGSALNSARTIQIFLPPLASIFVGAIGDDSNGHFLQQTAFEQGVDMKVQILPEFSTSTCLCFITPDFERTLVVQRSAHAEYSLDSTFQAVVGQVDIVYIVSFALSTLSRFACA
ncbi:hypothetical protein Ae201684_005896 [Aphanomyces euteiches]|uniref:Adenosine kinase n=1 Tax=Aphanomyces euteiches TaxID=100861 RepID=A0A6G0XD14_9STRA|nr:hypothetical protein Ae201684_005896 [Aphanomyces euteiches]KAH9153548.1 hypothetical protein AeRB84_004223 [Aphanomyces euteiches]